MNFPAGKDGLRAAVGAQFVRPSGREVGFLITAGALVLGISLAALGPKWWRVGLIGEWATYMAVAFGILSWRPFRSAVGRTSPTQKLAVAACFLLLAVGQFVGGGRHTFPLVRFQMFTDLTSSKVRQYHLLGIAHTGDTVPIDPVQLFPSLDRGRFDSKLNQSVEAAIGDGPGSRAAKTYDDLLLAILKRYNLDARDKIVRLEVHGVDVDLDRPPRGRVNVEGALVWSVEVKP